MIVLGIIAFIAGIALPRISNRNNDLRAAVRRFTTLSRQLRQLAQLQNATYRLVIDMEDGSGFTSDKAPADATGTAGKESANESKRVVTYWVERGPGSLVSSYDAKNPPKLPKPGDKKDEDAPADAFAQDTTVLKSKKVLDKGLDIESVELGRIDEPVTSGIIYIHYLPSGFVDEAVIHLKASEKLQWTLATEPLTGRMDIIPENRSLKDLRSR